MSAFERIADTQRLTIGRSIGLKKLLLLLFVFLVSNKATLSKIIKFENF